jgi:hypothetical protein
MNVESRSETAPAIYGPFLAEYMYQRDRDKEAAKIHKEMFQGVQKKGLDRPTESYLFDSCSTQVLVILDKTKGFKRIFF